MKLPKYLAWVREQPCVSCGAWPPSEAHHVKAVCHLSGAGMKCTDLAVMPLCRLHHDNEHRFPTEMQIKWAFQTLDKAVEEGILVVDTKRGL